MDTVAKYRLVPFQDEIDSKSIANDSMLKLALYLARIKAYDEDLNLKSNGKKRVALLPILKYASNLGGSSTNKNILLKHLIAANVNGECILNQEMREEYLKIKDDVKPIDLDPKPIRWTTLN